MGAGRPSKYETNVKPFLKQIGEWKRNGATDEQIEEKLGVSHDAFITYKKKYSELSEVLKKSIDGFVADLRGELARLAFKHTLSTTKVYYKKNDQGELIEYQEKTEKEIDGDIAAIHLLLKNLDRDNWADNPQKLALQREELKLKQMLAEANNFDLDLGGEGK